MFHGYTHSLDKEGREDFHKSLRAHIDILTKKVYSTKDDTCHNLNRIINTKALAVVPGDKDSCALIMKRADYIAKILATIDDGITCGVYTPTTDNTPKNLKTFRPFLYRNFKNHSKYEKMLRTSKQLARLYGTAKPRKICVPRHNYKWELKFWPIIPQTGTYTYNAVQVIAEYLKPLVDENPYIICNTQDVPSILKAEPSLETDEK